MKSKELRKMRKADVKRKILLINPKKKKNTGFQSIHNGLGTLAGVLKKRGHEVFVVDYPFMREEQNRDISFFVKQFNPDIVGVSIYTPNANGGTEVISRIHEIDPNLPIMVGGPHATLYSDVLQKDKRIDYIFVGEAELTIIGVVENAKKRTNPEIIEAEEIVDLDDIPLPDYKSFYKWESIISYPIMTSRGCPFKCSFCASFGLSNRRWRFRKVEDCIRELEIAKETISPDLTVMVMDDCPTVGKKRFNEFLYLFSKKIRLRIHIANTRADQINEEFLTLLKKCKCDDIAIGVEHAHPEVFKLVGKGETLEQIEKACRLIKKYRLRLGLTFIIGLPGDNFERTKASIRFCKKVKGDFYSINLIIPFRNTAARKWFEENGAKLYDEIGQEAQNLRGFECVEPIVETSDFTREERKKAYYMFLFGIIHDRLKLRKLKRIFEIARKYNLYSDFFYWFPRGILKSLQGKIYLIKKGFVYIAKGEFGPLMKRYRSRRLEILDRSDKK